MKANGCGYKSEYKKKIKNEAINKFRNELLPLTVANAVARSKFYANFYGQEVIKVQNTEDLSTLPILTKQLVVENFDDIIIGTEIPGLIQHTTGTTGTPLPVYRSKEEIDFINLFFSRLINENDTKPIPVVLHLSDSYHGPSLGIPSHEYSIPVGMTDDILLSQAVHLLTDKQKVPGFEEKISVIVGLVPYIKTLTNYLLEIAFDFSRSAVKSIVPLSTILTPRWRDILTSTWNANIIDRYSLTEIFGGATYCLRCKNFHFDPFVVPEVVEPFYKTPIESGIGVLVMTSLYPFVQKQPMIRYWTGDLVEVCHDSCRSDLSVKFKGRISNACYIENDGRIEFIVFPVDLYEILDYIPDIAFSKRFIDISLINDHSAAGSLKFEFEKKEVKDATEIKLKIELKYTPHLYRDRIRFLRDHITNELFLRCSNLKHYVNCGRISFNIEFFGPNTLSAFPIKV
jgi:phenylacetate-coenzyme A ligase PaaK-like adenylate-forming protein